MITSDEISFFLKCGFLPQIKKNSLESIFNKEKLAFISKSKMDLMNENKIIKSGVDSIRKSFNNIKGNLQVVPLSGGLDSRLILAELIRRGHKENIIAVTFGIPGSYDFEIPKLLSKKFGFELIQFDLNKTNLEEQQLEDVAAKSSSFTFLFDAYYNSLISRRFGSDATYWSGFAGGSVSGTLLPLKESDSWKEAKLIFLKNNTIKCSQELASPGFVIDDSLPVNSLVPKDVLNYDDQLNFGLRQQNYIKRIVSFPNYEYRMPFMEADWVNFIFSLPRKYRVNNNIYYKVLLESYPDLFTLPTANGLGGRLGINESEFKVRKVINLLHKKTKSKFVKNQLNLFFNVYNEINYLNFDQAIREREDYKNIIKKNVFFLQERGVVNWLDIERIYNEHIKSINNHGLALILLTALEISIKTKN